VRTAVEFSIGWIKDRSKEKILACWISALRPTEFLLIGFLCFLNLILLLHGQSVPHRWLFFVLHLLWIAGIFALFSPWAGNGRWQDLLRFWYFVPITIFLFKEQYFLVRYIRPFDLDALLIRLDYALFGTHPTVYLERWTTPWLTELLQWAYISYFFLPIILGLRIYRERDWAKFQRAAFAIILSYCVSLTGYILVPALGPRFTLMHLQTVPLGELFLAEEIRDLLNHLEQIQRDAFPSGHTMIALITLYYIQKFYPRMALVLFPVVGALVFSTVYLRYHYVVDVLAGMILAAGIVALTECWLGSRLPHTAAPRRKRIWQTALSPIQKEVETLPLSR
jgi:membrane-associated phospholipid phosphatase